MRAEPSLQFLMIIGSDLELFVYQSILDIFRCEELFSGGPKTVFHSMSHNFATKVLKPCILLAWHWESSDGRWGSLQRLRVVACLGEREYVLVEYFHGFSTCFT